MSRPMTRSPASSSGPIRPTLGFTDICCGPQARGVAVAYGKVFAAQLDGHVVALDARTGKVVWKTDHADTLPQPTHYLFLHHGAAGL